jgi:integrase
MGKLTPLFVSPVSKPGKYPDGDNLYFIVSGPNAKNWSYRYWFAGKQRWHGLGSFQNVSLAEARLKRDAARLLVKGDRNTPGIDIVQAKRVERNGAQIVALKANAPTFPECAERYIEGHGAQWSEKHRDQWPSSLQRYAYPTIGHLPIVEIRPSHIFELLAPIWIEKRETSSRVRSRVETIIAKNADINDREFRNPAELTKQLREKLPKRPKRSTKHHNALPYAGMAEFMAKLGDADGMAARALAFGVLTVARTGEVLGAAWSEFDFASKTWCVPGIRMKMGESHTVPLSPRSRFSRK